MSIQAFKNDNISLKRIIKEKQIEIEITQKKNPRVIHKKCTIRKSS